MNFKQFVLKFYAAVLALIVAKPFLSNVKATGHLIAGEVIGMVIDAYIIAYTMPDALTHIVTGNWTGTGSAITAFGTVILPIVIMAGLIFAVLRSVGVVD